MHDAFPMQNGTIIFPALAFCHLISFHVVSFQDAVAVAVAEEVQRGHRAELGPTPPSLTVTREEKEREEEEAMVSDGG